MKKNTVPAATAALISVSLMLTLLSACGRSGTAVGPAEPVSVPSPTAPVSPAASADTPVIQLETGRQNGERFEDTIILEGMEETVRYEHVRNDTVGFEIDYDYESFVRRSDSSRDCFISVWDNAAAPENYLEVTYSPEDADTVSAAIGAALSEEYEISRSEFTLDRAGRCIRIDASEVKGGGFMPEQLQTVYIIPAADGCRIATEHYFIEGAEGFGRRFSYMMYTFRAIDRLGQ